MGGDGGAVVVGGGAVVDVGAGGSEVDDVVPLPAVRDIAERLYVNHIFNIVEDDHSLHDTFPTYDWDTLLQP